MRYDDMTIQQRRRMRGAKCPICGKEITQLDDVQITQIRYGRRIINFYIHSACLLDSLVSSQLGGINNEEKAI